MTTKEIDFNDWSQQLESVWKLKTEKDCDLFWELMDAITGKEDIQFAERLIDAVRLAEDNGVYESLYNALWAFPEQQVARLLAQRLPEFHRRMGRYDQVHRFYLPIGNEGIAQDEFVKTAGEWTAADRRTAIAALKKWSVDNEDWESALMKLGKTVKKTTEDPIPEDWPDEWKKRLEKGRKKEGEFGLSDIFWNGGKKNWLADLDFLFEVLAMNHGAKWRQINAMTNALWFFAHTTVYPEFISRLALLPADKQTKILNNIKKCNRRKYNQLVEELTARG